MFAGTASAARPPQPRIVVAAAVRTCQARALFPRPRELTRSESVGLLPHKSPYRREKTRLAGSAITRRGLRDRYRCQDSNARYRGRTMRDQAKWRLVRAESACR